MPATARIRHRKTKAECAITLTASELAEMKLSCNVIGDVDLRALNRELFPDGLVRVLCGSGMAFARQNLVIPNGLEVKVSQVQGFMDKSDEVGVCYATAIAIARSLQRDVTDLLTTMDDWEVLE